MTRQERIHRLFNELHEALTWEEEDAIRAGTQTVVNGIAMRQITSGVDKLHHDYTLIQLEGCVD